MVNTLLFKFKCFSLISFMYFYILNDCLMLDFRPVKRINILINPESNMYDKKLLMLHSSNMPIINKTYYDLSPMKSDDSLSVPNSKYSKIKIKGLRDRKVNKSSSNFRHFIMNGKTIKRESKTKGPSIIGSIFLYIIMVVVLSVIFIMLVCFMHKWRENMAVNTNFPKVEYSMLRQGEDEPEDPLGEILINIGLAAPEDIRSHSESELEENENINISSCDPTLSHIPLEKTLSLRSFTNVPLQNDEILHLIPNAKSEESDEEMLQ
ncbi:UNVERIFIED_CONTAM: hypothetical protein RMT77_010088 [Armadillidium vulgare]